MSHTDDDLLHNPDVAHEHSDVNLQAVLAFAAGTAVVTAAIAVLMAWMFNVLEGRAAAGDPTISPLARPATEMPPTTSGSPFFGSAPGPQLLVEEPAALSKQRALENERLQTYGWVDEKAGTARMPLDEAKKLILQRGLPMRAGGTPDAALGTHRPAAGESSGGRTLAPRAGTS